MNALLRRQFIGLLAAIPITAGSWNALSQIDSEDDLRAPFGLTWGVSAEDVRRTGVTLSPFEGPSDYGAAFTATGLSKVLSDSQVVILFFGYRDSLVRIVAVGRPVDHDPYGARVISRYNDLAVSLGERYGNAHEVDQRDTQVWKAPNEYVTSLRQGRAHRYTDFRNSSMYVQLSINAIDPDTSQYVIFFVSRPEMAKFESDKKAKEKDAL